MSSYPIVHTKKNPVKMGIITGSRETIADQFNLWISEFDYVDIYDIIKEDSHSYFIYIIIYKTKYKGEVVDG